MNLLVKVVVFLGLAISGNALQIHFRLVNNYLYQTTLSAGENQAKNLTVLLDLSANQTWLFSTKNATNASDNLYNDQSTPTNRSIQIKYSTQSGLYDQNFNVSANQSDIRVFIIDGSANASWARIGLVNADKYGELRGKDQILGAGILGAGQTQSNGSGIFAYLSQLLHVNVTRFVLCTRPPYSQAVLVINEDYFNASILANATITPINRPNRISQSGYEFNITSVKIGTGYYYEAPMVAAMSTLSNYVTVDTRTWQHIQQTFRPEYDRRTSNYLINCWMMRRLRIELNVQRVKGETRTRPLMIPGSELVTQTKSGYCVLKIRPYNGSAWVLGGPFLRHHCVQFDIADQQITFVNNSIFYPWKKHIYG